MRMHRMARREDFFPGWAVLVAGVFSSWDTPFSLGWDWDRDGWGQGTP